MQWIGSASPSHSCQCIAQWRETAAAKSWMVFTTRQGGDLKASCEIYTWSAGSVHARKSSAHANSAFECVTAGSLEASTYEGVRWIFKKTIAVRARPRFLEGCGVHIFFETLVRYCVYKLKMRLFSVLVTKKHMTFRFFFFSFSFLFCFVALHIQRTHQ